MRAAKWAKPSNMYFVFRGCNVEFNASSMSDSTLVNFNTLLSGSSESLALLVRLPYLSAATLLRK